MLFPLEGLSVPVPLFIVPQVGIPALLINARLFHNILEKGFYLTHYK
ncbi:hypothetical protein CLV42_11949 [Chitinophaga ginsengisoli]|uniref:Uncharacterized protein n=1 Tax=Chitinophaga ginsengisoli TaxID=363837 RepID=A0A2P8FMT3_9BACT|nr:hypothetical protein CLV42_11949 [Chitinophaga ginsengisoli]